MEVMVHDKQLPKPSSAHIASAYLFTFGRAGQGTLMVEQWLRELGIDAIDQVRIGEDDKITIAQIRELQRQVLLAPVKGPWRAGLILNAQRLTSDASHALLKSLEDPPKHALFILLAEHEDQLLPTIVSRCQRWHVALPEHALASDPRFAIDQLRTQSLRERFSLAEAWAKEDTFLENFDGLLRQARRAFLGGSLSGEVIHKLLKYRADAQSNVSRRLLAEVSLLSLPGGPR